METICNHLESNKFESVYICLEFNNKLEAEDINHLLTTLKNQTEVSELYLLIAE